LFFGGLPCPYFCTPLFSQIIATSHLQAPCHPLRLNPDEEIAAYLSSFGQTMLIQIEKVGYHNPFFIVFYGSTLDDNRPESSRVPSDK
jgi:hypothetical protein